MSLKLMQFKLKRETSTVGTMSFGHNTSEYEHCTRTPKLSNQNKEYSFGVLIVCFFRVRVPTRTPKFNELMTRSDEGDKW